MTTRPEGSTRTSGSATPARRSRPRKMSAIPRSVVTEVLPSGRTTIVVTGGPAVSVPARVGVPKASATAAHTSAAAR